MRCNKGERDEQVGGRDEGMGRNDGRSAARSTLMEPLK